MAETAPRACWKRGSRVSAHSCRMASSRVLPPASTMKCDSPGRRVTVRGIAQAAGADRFLDLVELGVVGPPRVVLIGTDVLDRELDLAVMASDRPGPAGHARCCPDCRPARTRRPAAVAVRSTWDAPRPLRRRRDHPLSSARQLRFVTHASLPSGHRSANTPRGWGSAPRRAGA